jgi:hypothetical protein
VRQHFSVGSFVWSLIADIYLHAAVNCEMWVPAWCWKLLDLVESLSNNNFDAWCDQSMLHVLVKCDVQSLPGFVAFVCKWTVHPCHVPYSYLCAWYGFCKSYAVLNPFDPICNLYGIDGVMVA